MPLNVSEFGLNIIRFISNLFGEIFFQRAGPVISTCVLEKDVTVRELLIKEMQLNYGLLPKRVDPPPLPPDFRNFWGTFS